jgi:hypothetical protein
MTPTSTLSEMTQRAVTALARREEPDDAYLARQGFTSGEIERHASAARCEAVKLWRMAQGAGS